MVADGAFAHGDVGVERGVSNFCAAAAAHDQKGDPGNREIDFQHMDNYKADLLVKGTLEWYRNLVAGYGR